MSDFNEEKLESLYKEKKILQDDIIWEQISSRSGKYSCIADALTIESNEILRLHGEYLPTGYSFVLRYQNTVVRLFDINNHHEGIDGGHKHRYPETEFFDEDPYPVNDVSTYDVNQGLRDFMDECKIRYRDVTINDLAQLSTYE